MRAIWIVPVIVSILILGTLGISQDAFAFTQGVCNQTIIENVTLTADILNCSGNALNIRADFITLDCDGHTLTGIGPGSNGIVIIGRTEVTVTNCHVSNFSLGFLLLSSSNNTLSDNTANDNTFTGFELRSSSSNTLKDNTASDNRNTGFHLRDDSNSNVLESNTANNHNSQSFSAGFLLGSSSDGNTLRNNMADNNIRGFLLSRSNSNNLEGNTATNNRVMGFVLSTSSNSNNLESNTATNNGQAGFRLFDSDNNNLKSNTSNNNGSFGFSIVFSDNNTLEDNTFSNNPLGIRLIGTSGNTVFHNNIIANTRQASASDPTLDDWHDPVLLEGNFWSDYLGVDDGSGAGKHAIAGDGIGDTQIPFPRANFDNFPFVEENGWKVLSVDIDIKPGSDLNCINTKNKGLTPIAILGSVDFDVTTIDQTTLEIDDDGDSSTAGVSPTRTSIKDVNGDGFDDLNLKFATTALLGAGLLVDENELFITGETDSTAIVGSDIINLAGGPNCFD